MEGAPPLTSLCLEVIRASIRRGWLRSDDLSEFPSHLVDSLLASLDPVELETFAPKEFDEFQIHKCSISIGLASGVKRGRFADLNGYWKVFFISRWPAYVKKNTGCKMCSEESCFTDWQQLYWEMHLQSCLDEASEIAALPGFHGHLGEITISDNALACISKRKDKDFETDNYMQLSYHSRRFGHYARRLRLQNVLCVAEMCELLSSSYLQHAVFCSIKSGFHIDGVCNLLARNQKSLLSLKFLRCMLPPKAMDKICEFLGRTLFSLKFCESQLGLMHAKSIFNSLHHLSSGLSDLEISDSDIKRWQYNANFRYKSIFASLSEPGSHLEPSCSIRVLNLRGNELDKNDARDLRCCLVNMQSLGCLDLSDNPLTDDGVRILIPYIMEAMARPIPLIDLKLENCHLSSVGATELLTGILKQGQSLKALSIACNDLGRSAAVVLARFLQHSDIKTLNIEDVGLGSLGFDDFESALSEDIRVIDLNISKNRGGIGAARCISKIVSHAPELASIDASHNLMPLQSAHIIHHALRYSKGKLQKLDLTGNPMLHQAFDVFKLTELCCQGKPIVILPAVKNSAIPYDDDP